MFSFEVIENYSKERGEFLATAGIGNVTLINFSFVLTFVLFKYVLLYENVKLKRFCFCFTSFSFFLLSQMKLNQKYLMILERKRKTVLRPAWKIQYASL